VKNSAELLKNYHDLVHRVDSLCGEIVRTCADSITCRKGCDVCCRHFSVFWVEAVNLARAAGDLPKEQLALLRNRAESLVGHDVCPLLDDGSCILYAHRPIICRTHGLPIIIRHGEDVQVDYCPRNFQNVATLPGNAIVDLDRLNETLAAINLLFVSRYFGRRPPPTARLTICEALMLKI
jgi:Fe-S-cluster containining protein